ncbi:hypothetical protein M8818_006877 [Zalaria obscura]|uniref:Uncharacterized protein n=1 Tax=Zalaria obscura TaxID=2024903 RepID=A0ACC3S634_9PEZI
MMRSFFGDQEGPFSLSIRSISAVTHAPSDAYIAADASQLEKGEAALEDESFIMATMPVREKKDVTRPFQNLTRRKSQLTGHQYLPYIPAHTPGKEVPRHPDETPDTI